MYDAHGKLLEARLAPFAHSVAGTAVSLLEACVMNDLTRAGAIELQPFEQGRRSILAAPLAVAPGLHAVIELFDKTSGPFTPTDQRLVQAAADLGAEMLRQALGQRQQHELLLDAVGAALAASDHVAAALPMGTGSAPQTPPPAQVIDQLRLNLSASGKSDASAAQSLALAEAIRVLGVTHGPEAVEHCIRLVKNIQALLDNVMGSA